MENQGSSSKETARQKLQRERTERAQKTQESSERLNKAVYGKFSKKIADQEAKEQEKEVFPELYETRGR